MRGAITQQIGPHRHRERVATGGEVIFCESTMIRKLKSGQYRLYSRKVDPIEAYRNRLILYGCGDLINDYEGIGGNEQYRDDLVLMCFATLNPTNGNLVQLRMTPMQIRKMRLNRAAPRDTRWHAAGHQRVLWYGALRQGPACQPHTRPRTGGHE